MNKLWVFGDSFSTGGGYPDKKTFNKFWPSIVANKLGLKLVNKALGGRSNETILTTMITNLHKINKGDYVIIGLTDSIRFEIYDWNVKRFVDIVPGSEFVQNGLIAPERSYYWMAKGYKMFEQKGPYGSINEKKGEKLRKLTLKYIALVRGETREYLTNRDIKTAVNYHKELKQREVGSIVWSWDDHPEWIRKETPFKYDLIPNDGHWTLEGNKQFSERILDKINKGGGYWEDIYE